MLDQCLGLSELLSVETSLPVLITRPSFPRCLKEKRRSSCARKKCSDDRRRKAADKRRSAIAAPRLYYHRAVRFLLRNSSRRNHHLLAVALSPSDHRKLRDQISLPNPRGQSTWTWRSNAIWTTTTFQSHKCPRLQRRSDTCQ